MKPQKLIGITALLCLCTVLVIGYAHSKQSAGDKKENKIPEISFGYWDIDQMQNSAESDGITQYLEEKFGFLVNAQSFNWSNYKQQYQILSSTGELPDVFTTVLLSSNNSEDTAMFKQMVADKMIQALPKDLSAYPNLEKLLSQFPELRQKDGCFYTIPHPTFTETILSSSDAAMIVRRDWMNNLGIDDPQNIQEFIQMTSAFASMDPDGNGKDDTIGYNVNNLAALGKWVMLGIAPKCNVYSWLEKPDGTFCPAWNTDEFRDVVAIYRQLYECGGLDPDFYVKNPSSVLDDFTSGRLGALEYKSSAPALAELKEEWDAKNTSSFSECVDVLPIFPASDGIRYSNSSNSYWSETYINASVTEEELHIILKLLDYLLSDEGISLCSQGIEGVDYRLSSDESPVSLITDADSSHVTALQKKYHSIELWSNIVYRGWDSSYFSDTPYMNFLYGKDCMYLVEKSLKFCNENTVQVSRPYSFLTFPKENASFDSTAFQSFVRCIIGAESPLKMWDATLDKLRIQGLDEYIHVQNQRFISYLLSRRF